MLAQWEVEFFGKKRAHRVKDLEIAKEIGWHPKYLSAVLNGKRTPKDAEKKLSAALDAIIARNKTNEAGA
jgi:predicted urease superfamily metal-dependent hydrolase